MRDMAITLSRAWRVARVTWLAVQFFADSEKIQKLETWNSENCHELNFATIQNEPAAVQITPRVKFAPEGPKPKSRLS